MWTSGFYIYTYRRRQEFQNIIEMKENYAIALNSCYLFTKMLSMGLNMIYIDTTYGDIRLS